MNKTIISIMAVMLCGCVDLGRVGLHPELKRRISTDKSIS
jgi:hypothetical protein